MKQFASTPRWVDRMIDRFAPPDLAEEIRGDLYELYERDLSDSSPKTARWNYAKNAIGFLFKHFFWKRKTTSSNSPIMVTNYFRSAWRSLVAYKGNAVINTLGLMICIASALVIFSVVRFETSFDTFHSNADRIYRLVRVSGENMDEFRTGVSWPVVPALRKEIPGLDRIVSVQYAGGATVAVLDKDGKAEKIFAEDRGVAIVEPSIFEVLDFKGTKFRWISGNPKTALAEPNSVVLSESMSKKYFGDEPALGKTLRFEDNTDCKVSGVIADLPLNTDFPFTVLASYATLYKPGEGAMNEWIGVNDSHHAYLVLPEGKTTSEIEQLIAKVHATHTPEDVHRYRHYLLQPLSEIHYDARYGTFGGRTISKETLLAISLIAAFLLISASINYINLSTAQSVTRAKEIGLRKVMGSNRKSLVIQFLTETFVVVGAAGVMGLFLAELFLYRFQSLLNMPWQGYHFTDTYVLLAFLSLIVGITAVAGFYPSWKISNFNPIASLKNTFASERVGGFGLRKVLVVFQFTITQVLVVGTFIVTTQMNFFNQRDMGFNKEAIVTMPLPNNDPAKLSQLASQLEGQSFVSGVSFSFTLPSGANRYHNYNDISRKGATRREDNVIFEYSSIDPKYLDLYQIKLISGRNVREADTIGNILINETLVKRLSLGTAEEALGAELRMNGKSVTVVGVVHDFYSSSLKAGINPTAMVVKPDDYYALSLKLNSAFLDESLPQAMSTIEDIWKSTYPQHVFSYQFFDENIRAFYEQEAKYAQLFQMFSIIFLSIGCLGLYGLITFVVNRKSKEMAIRKVMGANVSQILVLFSKEYIQMISLSLALAIPVAYYGVTQWLENFQEKIPLQWWLFVLPGALVLAIALIVITVRSLKTAQTNPIDSLRYE